jgi:YidC/Oxa1 family membrane protein insertase
MNPRLRRILIPALVMGIATGIVAVGIFGRGSKPAPPPISDTTTEAPDESADQAPDETTPAEATTTDAGEEQTTPPDAAAPATFEGLIATAPPEGRSGPDLPTDPIGSLDPAQGEFELRLSRSGAGIAWIGFSNIWETARARRQADIYFRAAEEGQPRPPAPPEELRYVLKKTQVLRNDRKPGGLDVPILAANQVDINGTTVNLLNFTRNAAGEPVFVWAETSPGVFETVVRNADGEGILHITRRFILNGDFGLTIEQRFRNLTSDPLEIRYSQFGPADLNVDRSRYMDRRRFRFGFLDPDNDPERQFVLSSDSSLLLERNDVVKQDESSLWPNEESTDRGFELTWFAGTNRYFALAVHPVLDADGAGSKSLAETVGSILHEKGAPQPDDTAGDDETLFTYLVSPVRTIAPAGELSLDMGVYAGPLDRHVLGQQQPFLALNMQELILYQMSSCCAVCTFQWLAKGLLGFLTLLQQYVVFDWGVAIIILVLCVRTLLHPITKKSQISMQRFGKAMTDLKPELDKLQKKFPNDPKKMQQEQLRLMRERGVNPLQMLGCLPMFLQTPIWIALYAMLYFVFDLRQEPAFFGIFQQFGGWAFLGDLSSADHFFGELETPRRFLIWNVTGINFLPILMGVIFYIQQKYMSPPPSPTMSQEQLQQQKLMKIMMVVMFPVMLYSAPSGLTLYILTSSCIGILESRYIRSHIKEMDLKPPKPKKKARTKPKDAQGRAFAAAMERREEKKRAQQRGPQKKYKKRK